MAGTSTLVNENLIMESFEVACRNWLKWRDVFEHAGSLETNPLLAQQYRFSSFCHEYAVARTIRHGTQDRLRRLLVTKLPAVVRDNTGRALDKLEAELRPQFGTHNPPRSILSVLSKVTAFARPERFVAWDRFGRKGLNIVLGRGVSTPFQTYADYLEAFDSVWDGPVGKQIEDSSIKSSRIGVERQLRFLRRVLDVFLMKCGDREI